MLPPIRPSSSHALPPSCSRALNRRGEGQQKVTVEKAKLDKEARRRVRERMPRLLRWRQDPLLCRHAERSCASTSRGS